MRILSRHNRSAGVIAVFLITFAGIGGSTVSADEQARSQKLGTVQNVISNTLVPGTRYENIVSIGCGWASGVNFVGGIDWVNALPAILSNPRGVYDTLTDPVYFTPYGNRYVTLVKEALEARDGHTINVFDLARSGHTSPYGRFEIDEMDEIIADNFGGKLTGNTLVLYEYGPPDFLRLLSMLYDRDPALNPIATAFGGDPFPPGATVLGDSHWQARLVAEIGADPDVIAAVLERYWGHFFPTWTSKITGATAYVDDTDVLGAPNTNDLTISDRFFASYKRDYRRLIDNTEKKYGDKVDIIAIGNENPYEGGKNFAQYANSAALNPNAGYPCSILPTFFGCRPDRVATPELGIDESFVHPFADSLVGLARAYNRKMRIQAESEGVSLIDVVQLFAGHHSRFDDPASPYYVADDPTYWAYMAEINALGQEVVADVMLHILNTGKVNYARKHSDEFLERARANEFPGVYGY
jgi:hypothetical protein